MIAPLVAEVNPSAARTVTGVFDLVAKPVEGAGKKVARALADVSGALTIHPSQIGRYSAR